MMMAVSDTAAERPAASREWYLQTVGHTDNDVPHGFSCREMLFDVWNGGLALLGGG